MSFMSSPSRGRYLIEPEALIADGLPTVSILHLLTLQIEKCNVNKNSFT